LIALGLIGLVLAQVPDCNDGQATWIAELEASGSSRAYGCLAADPSAATALIERSALLEAAESGRLTRALAVWRLQRLNEAVTPAESRAYNPADRRLLLDGIKAHRGRRSPAPAHLLVFEKMDWYQPVDSYTNARLTPQDRRNLAMLEHPPEPEVVEKPPVEPPAPDPKRSICGCDAARPAAGFGWLFLALALVISRRSGPAPSGAPRTAAPLLGG
jgi:hypothetical protein